MTPKEHLEINWPLETIHILRQENLTGWLGYSVLHLLDARHYNPRLVYLIGLAISEDEK